MLNMHKTDFPASSKNDHGLLNNEKIIQNNQAPIVGLKSLLQSSSLIELLLRTPAEESTKNVPTITANVDPIENSKKSPSNNLVEENIKYNSLFDIDILDECLDSKTKSDDENQISIYGNAFFGQSLWDKSELYPSDKMGVKFQFLEVDDFLNEINENGLNEADAKFLDQFNYDVSKPTSTNTTNTSTNNNNITNQVSVSPQLVNSKIERNKETLKKTQSDQNSDFSNDFSVDLEFISEHDDSNKMSDDDDDDDEQKFQSSKKSKKMSFEQLMMNSNTKSLKKNKDKDFDFTNLGLTEIEIELESELLQSDDSNDDFDLEEGVSDEKTLSQKGKKRGKKFVPNELKDEKYWSRRLKNNVAAKRSRDTRRLKENKIAVRAKYLERENDALRKYLEDSRREVKSLKTKCARYEAAAANNGSLNILDEK